MVYFAERPTSPTSSTSNPPSQEREYICEGVDDAETVKALAWQATPGAVAVFGGILYRQDVRVARQGHELYYVTVPYGPRDRQTGKWTWSADFNGGQFTIKTALSTVNSYVAAGQVAKDHKGAINRQPDGTVEGAPIVIPAFKLNITYSHPLGIATLAYARYVASLVGKVNSAPFLGWNPGEVLFLGGTMSDGTEAEATAGYVFAMERNLQNAIIGGITVAQKQGHDFAWIEFRNTVDGGQAVTIPRQIDVCRVYERVDLKTALNL